MNKAAGILRTRTQTCWILIAIFGAALFFSIRLFVYVDRYAAELLYWDQWDVLESFFRHNPSISELFLFQFGPHREGLGLILNKYLYPLTHWSSRFESFMLAGTLVLAMLIALQLKRRLFGRLDYTDAVIPVLFLSLAQYENLVGPLNPAHSVFPLLLVVLYCLALTVQRPVWRCGMVLVLNFLMIYTGFAIFMGIVTIGVFSIACYRQLRRIEVMPHALPFVGLVIASLSLASYFVHYTFLPFVDCFEFPYRKPWDYPPFMAGMFMSATRVSRSIGYLTGSLLLGATILLALSRSWRAARSTSQDKLPLIIAALAGFSLFYSANTAVGRVCLGLGAAQASRYSTLLIPAFLAIYFYIRMLPRRGTSSVLAALLALIFMRAHRVDPGMQVLGEGKRNWGDCYKQTKDIDYCDKSTGFRIHPEPERTRLKAKLDFLEQHHLNLYRDQK